MSKITIKASVFRINTIIHFDTGMIEPVVVIHPPLVLNNGYAIDSFSMNGFKLESDFDLAPNDIIELTFDDHDPPGLMLAKVVERSNLPRQLTLTGKCPICGAPLFSINGSKFGRCLNRTCRAQLSQTTVLMLAALGLQFNHQQQQILNYTLIRGALRSPADIFKLPLESFYTENIEDSFIREDAMTFIQYLHSIRGHVSVDQVLIGLRIPGWDMGTIATIRQWFDQHHYGLLDLSRLFYATEQSQISNINWGEWNQMLVLPSNRQLIRELCTILNK